MTDPTDVAALRLEALLVEILELARVNRVPLEELIARSPERVRQRGRVALAEVYTGAGLLEWDALADQLSDVGLEVVEVRPDA